MESKIHDPEGRRIREGRRKNPGSTDAEKSSGTGGDEDRHAVDDAAQCQSIAVGNRTRRKGEQNK